MLLRMIIPTPRPILLCNCFVPVDNILRHCNVLIAEGMIQEVNIVSDAQFGSIQVNVDFGHCCCTDIEYEMNIKFECAGRILSAGFIDIQLNGAFGIDFSDPNIKRQDVFYVAEKLTRYGVTGFCPTMISSTKGTYASVIPTIGGCWKEQKKRNHRKYSSSTNHAHILGMHLEGPFFCASKRGAHPLECIHENMNDSSFEEIYNHSPKELSDAGVRIITLAPELPGALNGIESLTDNGIVASLGHTDSVLKDGLDAQKRGATLITHLYNAMRPFHHREPALLGLLDRGDLESERSSLLSPSPLHYSIIADGLHCHPAAVKIARSLSKNTVLVTDAMSAMGLGNGSHSLGASDVDVKDGRATVKGTDILAGSVASMDACVQNFRQFTGCDYCEVLAAATTNPANVLGIGPTNNSPSIEKRGAVCVGLAADLVLLDEDLTVLRTIVSGSFVYSKNESCSIFQMHRGMTKSQEIYEGGGATRKDVNQ